MPGQDCADRAVSLEGARGVNDFRTLDSTTILPWPRLSCMDATIRAHGDCGMGTLAAELVAHVPQWSAPRIYADANVPAGIVAFMRQRLKWDVLYVVEHDDLRRAPDARHFVLAREWRRTLVTLDRDYLDDREYPPEQSGGLIVLYAPTERLLTRTLAQIDERIFRDPGADRRSPLLGRKLMADPEWIAR
jgi:hypothetical protein